VQNLDTKVKSIESGKDPLRSDRKLTRSLQSAFEDSEDTPHVDALFEGDRDVGLSRLKAKHAELLAEDGTEPTPEEVLEEVEEDIAAELKKFGKLYSQKEPRKGKTKKQSKKIGQKRKTRTLSKSKTSPRQGKKKSRRPMTDAQREEEALNVLKRGFGVSE
jgi:hypothetical protein